MTQRSILKGKLEFGKEIIQTGSIQIENKFNRYTKIERGVIKGVISLDLFSHYSNELV